MAVVVKHFSDGIRHLEIVLACALLSCGLLFIPFQHYMPLSHFQHYSFAIFGCAAGFLLQATFSWRRLCNRGRLALLGSFAYLLAFALVLYLNPWMDKDGTMNTEIQLEFRQHLFFYFMAAGLPLSAVWTGWAAQKRKLAKEPQCDLDCRQQLPADTKKVAQ